MRHEGYEIKESHHTLSFRAPGQERFTRSYRLGDSYTLDALRSHSEHRRGCSTEAKTPVRYSDGSKVNLLIDIQAKIDAGKGVG